MPAPAPSRRDAIIESAGKDAALDDTDNTDISSSDLVGVANSAIFETFYNLESIDLWSDQQID